MPWHLKQITLAAFQSFSGIGLGIVLIAQPLVRYQGELWNCEVHVKAQAPNHPSLTTQLYFPGEPRNTRDSLFTPALLVNPDATFTFVLKTREEPDPGRYAV